MFVTDFRILLRQLVIDSFFEGVRSMYIRMLVHKRGVILLLFSVFEFARGWYLVSVVAQKGHTSFLG